MASSGEIQDWNSLRGKRGVWNLILPNQLHQYPPRLSKPPTQTGSALPLFTPGFPLCVCPHAAHVKLLHKPWDRVGLHQEHKCPAGRWGLASSQSFGWIGNTCVLHQLVRRDDAFLLRMFTVLLACLSPPRPPPPQPSAESKEDQFCRSASAPCSFSFCFFFSSFLSFTLRRLAFPMPPAWRMDSRRLARPVEGFTTSFGAPWTEAAGTGRTGRSHGSVHQLQVQPNPHGKGCSDTRPASAQGCEPGPDTSQWQAYAQPSQQQPRHGETEGLQLPGRWEQFPLPPLEVTGWEATGNQPRT